MRDDRETFDDYLWDRAIMLIDKASSVMCVTAVVLGCGLLVFNLVRYFLQ